MEEVLEREIGGRKFKLGRSLSQEAQDQIAEVIARHLDAFAWTASDMPESTQISCVTASPWNPRFDQYARGEESLTKKGDWSSGRTPRSCWMLAT